VLTPYGWAPTTTSLAEDLAWSLVQLAGEEGLSTVTIRSLARHARVSPGTISNHFVSKQELWALSASIIGRWLARATADFVDERGAVGLFPSQDERDRTYRLLVSSWSQLKAHALADPDVEARINGVTPVLSSAAARACTAPDHELTLAVWLCLEGLRHELVSKATSLTAADALAAFQQVEPSATRGPLTYE
jgi:AcrR family transcriptional regulator